MTTKLLPKFVEVVAQFGGSYLVFREKFIPVQDAVRHKRLAASYALEALTQLQASKAASPNKAAIAQDKMASAAAASGCYFCRYIRELHLLDGKLSLERPLIISDHPELMKHWDKGYQRTQSAFRQHD